MENTSKSWKFKYLLLIIFPLSFASFLTLGFELFEVSGISMEGTLYQGDKVLVWNFYNPCKINGLKNKVLLFKIAEDGRYYLKRCIGTSGDTIKITNSNIYVNGRIIQENKKVKKSWKIYSKNEKQLMNLLINNQIVYLKTSDPGFIVNTSIKEIETLIQKQLIDSIASYCHNEFIELLCFDKDLGWDIDNFGEYIVPFIGFDINDNTLLMKHYRKCIEKYQGKGSETFNEDYLFVMGDNRLNSIDSRFYGAIPKSLIVGLPMFIISYKYGVRWISE